MTQANEGTFKKKLLAVAVLAPAMALTACNSDDYTSVDPATIASGVVYDGYWSGARVCVDADLNWACGAGEPTTTSGSGGEWAFNAGLTASQLLLPIMAETVPGVTVDEDEPDVAIQDSITYMAPRGSTVVSALSTITHVESLAILEQSPSTRLADAIAQARSVVAVALGNPNLDILNYDAPAIAGANTDESDLAARVHLVNRSLTKRLVELKAQAEQAGFTDNFSDSALQIAAIRNVGDKLAETKAAVDASIPEGVMAQDLDPTTAEEVLAEVEADPTTTPEDLTGDDLADAAATLEAAQEVIAAEIEEETGETVEPEAPTGSTGGSGADAGGQGVS